MSKDTSESQSKIDVTTIGGLLGILSDNIESVLADSSDANIKKSNAILQNVNAIRGVYGLAFERTRIANLKNIRRDTYIMDDYLTPTELQGKVLGDDTERLERDKERENGRKLSHYQAVMQNLHFEIENNAEDTPDESFKYETYDNCDLEVINGVLANAKAGEADTPYKQDQYLLKHLTPAHFGIEV